MGKKSIFEKMVKNSPITSYNGRNLIRGFIMTSSRLSIDTDAANDLADAKENILQELKAAKVPAFISKCFNTENGSKALVEKLITVAEIKTCLTHAYNLSYSYDNDQAHTIQQRKLYDQSLVLNQYFLKIFQSPFGLEILRLKKFTIVNMVAEEWTDAYCDFIFSQEGLYAVTNQFFSERVFKYKDIVLSANAKIAYADNLISFAGAGAILNSFESRQPLGSAILKILFTDNGLEALRKGYIDLELIPHDPKVTILPALEFLSSAEGAKAFEEERIIKTNLKDIKPWQITIDTILNDKNLQAQPNYTQWLGLFVLPITKKYFDKECWEYFYKFLREDLERLKLMLTEESYQLAFGYLANGPADHSMYSFDSLSHEILNLLLTKNGQVVVTSNLIEREDLHRLDASTLKLLFSDDGLAALQNKSIDPKLIVKQKNSNLSVEILKIMLTPDGKSAIQLNMMSFDIAMTFTDARCVALMVSPPGIYLMSTKMMSIDLAVTLGFEQLEKFFTLEGFIRLVKFHKELNENFLIINDKRNKDAFINNFQAHPLVDATCEIDLPLKTLFPKYNLREKESELAHEIAKLITQLMIAEETPASFTMSARAELERISHLRSIHEIYLMDDTVKPKLLLIELIKLDILNLAYQNFIASPYYLANHINELKKSRNIDALQILAVQAIENILEKKQIPHSHYAVLSDLDALLVYVADKTGLLAHKLVVPSRNLTSLFTRLNPHKNRGEAASLISKLSQELTISFKND
jgi:hypothetical protein